MLSLAIRTDSSLAELVLVDDDVKVNEVKWEADRKLATTLLSKIAQLITDCNVTEDQIRGVIFYAGPGSFTGLRIGATVANTYAYAQEIPIVSATGDGWLADGIRLLSSGAGEKLVLPEYGGEAHVTL